MGNMIATEFATRIPMSPFLTATLARAADYATAQQHREVSVEHLLLALTEDPEASVVLKSSQIDMARLNDEVSDFVGRIEDRMTEAGASVAISVELRRILEAAAAAAQQGRRREINGAIVLAAIVGDGKSAAAHMLRSQGLTFEEAIRALQRAAQAKPAAPAAPSPPQASAEDLLATARERVQSRAAAATSRDAARPEPQEPEPAPSFGAPSRRFESGPPPEVDPHPAAIDPQPAQPSSDFDQDFEATFSDHDTGPPASPIEPMHRNEPSFGAPPSHPHADTEQLQVPVPARPAPPSDRAPQQRRGNSWAPPAPRGAPPQAAPGPGARGGRMPPPLPPSPGPLQVPGQIPAQFPSPGGPGYAGQQAPRGIPQSRVPWPEAIEPPSAPVQQSRPDGARRQGGPRTVISSGQLVHNVPSKMKVGVSLVCEARIGRAEVKAIVEGLQGGGAVVRQEIMVTKAMSVRLRSPDGGFFIEGSSPETQWIENVLGMPAEDFARWRWTITPREKGRKRLQLIVSARTVGADGLTAETAMPDQVIDIRVRTNYVRSFKRWLGWALAAIVGGILARFGDVAFGAVRSLLGL
jgi:hypothetical protein